MKPPGLGLSPDWGSPLPVAGIAFCSFSSQDRPAGPQFSGLSPTCVRNRLLFVHGKGRRTNKTRFPTQVSGRGSSPTGSTCGVHSSRHSPQPVSGIGFCSFTAEGAEQTKSDSRHKFLAGALPHRIDLRVHSSRDSPQPVSGIAFCSLGGAALAQSTKSDSRHKFLAGALPHRIDLRGPSSRDSPQPVSGIGFCSFTAKGAERTKSDSRHKFLAGALPNLCQEFHFVHQASLRSPDEQSAIPDTRGMTYNASSNSTNCSKTANVLNFGETLCLRLRLTA